MINITSLVHPVMIAKIQQGLKLAALGQGDKMGGHGNRVYIQNRKGRNILRIDWKGEGQFIAYGGADWGQTDVTEIVKEALQRSGTTLTPVWKDGVVIGYKKRPRARLFGLLGLLAVALLLMGSNDIAYADKPPTALENACIKQPYLLVCDWAFGPEKNLK